MNIRKIKIITSITIILIMLSIQVSYAIVGSNNNNAFLTVNTEEIEQKETLKIALDLNKIENDKFKIVLNTNIDNDQILTDDNITMKEESDAVVIEIDKTKLNLETIEMSYVVPEETEINSKIQLSVKVTAEEEVEQQDDEGNTNLVKQEKVVLEESKNISIIEKNDNTNTDNQKQDQSVDTSKDNEKQDKNIDTSKEQNNNKEKNQEDGNKQQGENSKDTTNKTSNSQNNKSMASTNKSTNDNQKNDISVNSISKNSNSSGAQSNKNVESAIYNGSNNNYLKNLSVKGVELNTSFNKENTTYFIKVTDTSNLKITATAEDSMAKVVVTGNDSIKEGTNKILIAVTAENGDIRYYRIFAKCKLSE